MKNKFVIITGATSGLGRAFALSCAQKKWPLILIDHSGSRVNEFGLNIQLQFDIKIQTFEIDFTDILIVMSTFQQIAESFDIFFLINNIGIGGTSKIQDTSIERITLILDINIKCTSVITRIIIPAMLRNNQQQYILNVASMAAFTPIAYKNVYPATKAFISSFSLGLQEELKKQNIHVAALYPGPIMTNSDVSSRIFKLGKMGTIGLLSTDWIANYAIEKTLAKKCMIIPGLTNQWNQLLLKCLPLLIKLKIISRQVIKEINSTPNNIAIN